MNPTAVSLSRCCAFPLLTGIVLFLGCQRGTTVPTTSPPSKTVTALGRLEPFDGIIQLSGVPGDRVERWLVKEGDWVSKDKELVELDSKNLRELEKSLAEIQRKEARTRRKAFEAYSEAQVAELELKLKRTQVNLNSDVEVLQAKVNLVAYQHKAARNNLKRLRELVNGAVPEQDIERQDLAVKAAQVDLISTQSMLAKGKDARDSGKEEAKVQMQALLATLKRTELEIPSEDTVNRNVELAQKRLEASLIKAPTEGRVLSILTRTGEAVGPRPLLRLGDTRQLAVVAEVDESDVLKVMPGQTATVSSTFFKQLGIPSIPGKVETVGVMVLRNGVSDLNPAALSDRRVVDVKILLDFSQVGEEVRKRLAHLIQLQVEVEIDLTPPPAGQ